MKYKVSFEKKAYKKFTKIDRHQQIIIWAWIEKNLIGTDNLKEHGKALKGTLKDYWRYRIGNYRILADIDNEEIKIIIFNIGHRKDIYE